jgi:hypothetical protein
MTFLPGILSIALLAIVLKIFAQSRFSVTLKDNSTVLVTRHYEVLTLGPFSCIVWEQVYQRRLPPAA